MDSELLRLTTGGYSVRTTLSDSEVQAIGSALGVTLHHQIADLIAKAYLEDHLQEILETLKPKAIANLAIAQAAREFPQQFGAKR